MRIRTILSVKHSFYCHRYSLWIAPSTSCCQHGLSPSHPDHRCFRQRYSLDKEGDMYAFQTIHEGTRHVDQVQQTQK